MYRYRVRFGTHTLLALEWQIFALWQGTDWWKDSLTDRRHFFPGVEWIIEKETAVKLLFGKALTIVVCTGIASTPFAQSAETGWHSDFAKAEAEAKQSGEVLLVHFYADWCGPCKAMERDVLNRADVQAALSNGIVAVKVNSDRRKDLVRRFGVTSLPTDVFVDAQGKQIGKHVGSPGRSGYLARLQRYRSTVATPDKTAIAKRSQPASSATVQSTTKPVEKSDPVVAVESKQVVERTAAKPVFDVASDKTAETTPSVAATDTKASEPAAVAENAQGDKPSADAATQSTTVASASAEKDTRAVADKKAVVHTRAIRRENNKRIGLSGYSPVALTANSKWVAGEQEFVHEFQGVCYLLNSEEELKKFKKTPQDFVPVLHGYDPIAFHRDQKMLTGAIQLGAEYRGKLYFFSSKSNRELFLKNPRPYTRSFDLTFFTASAETRAEL